MANTSSVSDFKKGLAPVELDLPSGNVCLARRRTLDVFMKEGRIPNSLMAIIQQQMNQVDGKPTGDLKDGLAKIMDDPGKLADIVKLADTVLMACVVEPKVNPQPEVEADRDDELLYVDEVDLDDKMFIFSWAVGGTKDLDRFREESSAVVVDIHSGKELSLPPQRTPGSD